MVLLEKITGTEVLAAFQLGLISGVEARASLGYPPVTPEQIQVTEATEENK